MSDQTLQKLLKPPFVRIGRQVLDFGPTSLRQHSKRLLFEIPDFLYCADAEKVLDFAVAAMNEKWGRASWGIKRWIYVVISETDHGIICPECRAEYSFPKKPYWSDYQYCPHCGQWLGEPEKQ